VIAGAVVASALSFVLLTAGTAIGLSLVSPYPSQSYGKLASSFAAFWVLAVPILSLLVGGYIAGRMRAAWATASADEVEFRDGIHGLLVWAVSVVIGGFLAFLTAATAAQVGADVGRIALTDRAGVVAPAVDTLMRTTVVAEAETDAPPVAPKPAAPSGRATDQQSPSTAVSPTFATRADVTRLLTASVADGRLSANDRQYLVEFVARRTGVSPVEAEKRVDQAYAQAVEAAEKARKAAVLAGLATATALLLGLAAAWYAAQHGGRHRDQNIPAKFTFLRPRVRQSTPGP
jgi:hypothetical protein